MKWFQTFLRGIFFILFWSPEFRFQVLPINTETPCMVCIKGIGKLVFAWCYRNKYDFVKLINEKLYYIIDAYNFIILFSDVCNDHQKLLHLLSKSSGTVLGSFKPELCSPVRFICKFYNVTLFSWNCPKVRYIKIRTSGI